MPPAVNGQVAQPPVAAELVEKIARVKRIRQLTLELRQLAQQVGFDLSDAFLSPQRKVDEALASLLLRRELEGWRMTTLEHGCAQAERDCIDLHRALAEAIRRLTEAQGWVMGARFIDALQTGDLREVLDRTSRP